MGRARDNRGFTLAEILVAAGLLVLVIIMVASMLLSSTRGFDRAGRLLMGRNLSEGVFTLYEQRLRTAQAVSVAAPLEGAACLWLDGDGVLYYTPEGGQPEALFPGLGMGIRIQVLAEATRLRLVVTVYDAEGDIAVKDSGFRLSTLARRGGTATGQAGTLLENPALYYTDAGEQS